MRAIRRAKKGRRRKEEAKQGPMQVVIVIIADRRPHKMMRWNEPLDLPFLRSQTKYDWSLAAVDVDVDSANHDVVALKLE
jgi:hypothetical protein